MLLAAYRGTGYNVVLFIHIVTVIIAMAGAVAHPLLFEFEKRRADSDMAALAQRIVPASRIYAIALILTGIAGFGMVSMSDKVIEFGDTWVWLSIVLWVALNGLLHAVMIPAEKAVAEGDTNALDKVDKVGPLLTVLVLVLIYLMIFKPGG